MNFWRKSENESHLRRERASQREDSIEGERKEENPILRDEK
jgi:hypothetical protein